MESRSPSGAEVPATTIDDIARENALDRVDFVKLDIEGSEKQALTGARLTIEHFAPRMAVCTYHRPEDPVEITALVVNMQHQYLVFGTQTQAYFYTAVPPDGTSGQGGH